MDIEFIELQHRQNVLQLMEICGLSLDEAYQLYTQSGNNLQAAVQRNLNKGFEQPPQSFTQQTVQLPKNVNQAFRKVLQNEVGDYDQTYQKYRQFRMNNLSFNKRYEVKYKESGWKTFIPKFFKSDESQFRKKMQNYMGKVCQVKFADGFLSENLQQVAQSKLPLIVHCWNFSRGQYKDLAKKIYSDEILIDLFNSQFKTFGYDAETYELEPYLRQFINQQAGAPCLKVFRVNVVDQIRLLQTINISQLSFQEIKKKLKFMKSNCIQIQMEEHHIQQRFNRELQGDFSYQKPMSIAEKRKLAQDREIRRKQQQQFFAMSQKPKNTNTSEQKKQKIKQQIKPTYKQPKKQEPPIKKQPSKNWDKQRQQMRNRLKKYTSGMMIKIRLPSGQSTVITVDKKQTVQYLFDYIWCLEENPGFENNDRKFDLIRPYDRLSLEEHKDKILQLTFEDSDMESLIVSEK